MECPRCGTKTNSWPCPNCGFPVVRILRDVDGDCNITINDALLILRYVLTGVNSSPHPGFPDGQADINYDGIIDTLDALMLLRIAMGLTTF